MTDETGYVFDTGPLSHFAQEGWLGVLDLLTGDALTVMPEAVERELSDWTHRYSHLQQVLEAKWLSVDRSDDFNYVVATARYEARLVRDEKNRGECAVLALAKTFGRIAVVDDSEARAIAADEGIEVKSTLAFLCEGIRESLINVAVAKKIVADLIRGQYRLPFEDADSFLSWAVENGQLEAEHVYGG